MLLDMARLRDPPPTTLIDSNRSVIEVLKEVSLPKSFSLLHRELMSGSAWNAEDPFSAILCDPPWYPEYYPAFTAQAAAVSGVGATVLLSLLPPACRPGAVDERWEILTAARQVGLNVVALERNAVRYSTPPFERASLRSSSLAVEDDWRAGDLLVLTKVANTSDLMIHNMMQNASHNCPDGHWKEILIGRRKVKIRLPLTDTKDGPELISIEPGDVLPTVSRRYSGRSRVDLWLWDNRVYGAKGRAAIWAALHIIAQRPIPLEVANVAADARSRAVRLLEGVLGHANASDTGQEHA
ncbi:MAG: hypothetical protein ABR998_06720 [Gemmatimonadales bacterium]